MMRRPVRLFLVVAAFATATTSMTSVAHADYQPPTELLGDNGPAIPLKNAAMIVRTEGGYRYMAGQQNSHLTITMANGKLLYVDTGTLELRDIPRTCSRQSVAQGIAALCKIPAKFDGSKMFLEVWPRLGNDVVDGSTLSANFRLWVLADAGFDTVYAGAGDDFVNGAQDGDRVWGGAGNDWIRTGLGNDRLWGGPGDDQLVGVYNRDRIHGGKGNDRVGGGPGNDVLFAGEGTDFVICGGGADSAHADQADRITHDCESVTYG